MRVATIIFLIGIGSFSHANENPEYRKFWEAWHKFADDARACAKNETVARFLFQSVENLGNAERHEANAGVIEDVVLGNPICFCRAYRQLSVDKREKISMFFIQVPLYHQPQDIKKALNSLDGSDRCNAF